jgi:vanillate O-demethylase ferredoxin subunit
MTTQPTNLIADRDQADMTGSSVDPAPIAVRVLSCIALTPRVKAYALTAASGRPLPAYAPGAHIRVPVIASNGMKESRSYSLIDPYDPKQPYRIAVQREPEGQGGSLYFHEHVKTGSEIDILPPSNHFPLDSAARHSVLIAGGIGITPIFCMAKQLHSQGQSYELHYAGRSADEMALYADVAAGLAPHSTIYTDDGGLQGRMVCADILPAYQPDRHVYVCGPAGLIQAVRELATERGWPETAVHFELFRNPFAKQADDADITVELRQTGITLVVQAGTSILDAVMAAGVDCDYDCRVGECGACLTNVIDGVPLHRDLYLNDKERRKGDAMCPCVSWASSRKLVLDL